MMFLSKLIIKISLQNFCFFALLCLNVFFSVNSQAAGQATTVTLDGQLLQAGTSQPLLDSAVRIKVQILDPSKTCLLYEEQQTVNTSSSNGYYTIQMGSAVGDAKRTGSDPGLSMTQVYQNTVAVTAANVPGQTCVASTYTPSARDKRYLRLTVTPSSTNVADTLSPDTEIGSVPSATVADTVQGYSPSQFVVTGTGDLTQANVQSVFATGNAAKLQTLLSFDPTTYVRNSGNGALPLPSVTGTPATPVAGQMWYDGGTIKFYNGSSTQSLGVSGAGITSLSVSSNLTAGGTAGGTLTGPGTIDLANSGVTAGSYAKVTVDAKGRVTAGTTLVESDVPTLSAAGKVSGSAITSGTIAGSTAISTTGNISAANITSTNSSANNILLYETTNTKKITIKAPATGSLTADYSLTLPTTVASSNGQVLTSDTSGNLSWSSPTSGVTLAGDVSGAAGTTSVDKIKGVSVVPGAYAASQVLKYDGSNWVNAILSSANLSNDSDLLKASNMPANCSANQTLTFSSPTGSWLCSTIAIDGTAFGSQTAGMVFAAPAGAAGTPTFRSLASTDFPSTIVVGNGDTSATPTAGTLRGTNASGTDVAGAALNIQGGAGTGAGAGGAITFSTSGAGATGSSLNTLNERMRITPAGNVGFGTANPNYQLQVNVNSGSNPSSAALTNNITGSAADPSLLLQRWSGTGSLYFGTSIDNSNGSILFETSGAAAIGSQTFTPRMAITNAGNVGIGTTSPGAKLDISAGNASANSPIINGTQTWNNAGTTFSAATLNVTDTASAAASKLIDLQVGGVSKFSVDKAGNITSAGTTSSSGSTTTSGNFSQTGSSTFSTGTGAVSLNGATTVAANQNLSMASGTGQFSQTYSGTSTAHSITSIGSGNIVDLITASTSAVNGDKGLNISISGANGTAGVTRYGVFSNVTATGSTSTNVAGYFSASGATNNYGLLVPNGNVGIGTTVPSYALEVNGASSVTGSNPVFLLKNTGISGEQRSYFTSRASDSRTFIRNLTGGGFAVTDSTGASDRFTVLDGGNVGIGTSAPATLTHILGSTSGTNAGFLRIEDSSAHKQNLSGRGIFHFYNTESNPRSILGENALGIAAGYDGLAFNYNANSTIASAGAGLDSPAARTLALYTSNGSSMTERMRIDSSGNVGIGTSSPTQPLEVVGNALFDSGFGAGISPSSLGQSGNAFKVGIATTGLGTSLDILNQNTGATTYGAFINRTGAATTGIGLYVNSTNATNNYSAIFQGGNVGIGTTTPSSTLDVNGSLNVRGTITKITLGNTTGTAQWVKLGTWTPNAQNGRNLHLHFEGGQGYNASYTQIASADLRLRTSNSISLDANGFCGSSVLSTSGQTAMITAAKIVTDAAGCSATTYTIYVYVQQYSGGGSFFSVENESYTTWASAVTMSQTDPGVASATVQSAQFENDFYGNTNIIGGNLGVGTASPSYVLDAQSASSNTTVGRYMCASGYCQLIVQTNAGGVVSENIANQTASAVQIGANSNHALVLRTNATERLRIDTSGNVGIGTTAPTALLQLKAGGSAASTAPLKLTSSSGTKLATPEDGALEYDGTNLFFTIGASRSQISNQASASGAYTNVGSITGSSALSVAAGGSNQNLTLSGSGTGQINFTNGDGTQFQVLDGGASTVNYLTVAGASTGNGPVLAPAGADTNINLFLKSKGNSSVNIQSNGGNVGVFSGASGVGNYFTFASASSGSSPVFGVNGSDANINLTLTPKGTGNTLVSSGNLGIGTASPSTQIHAYQLNSGVVDMLTLENKYSVSTGGEAIYFKGYYPHARISSSQNASVYQGGDLQLQSYLNSSTANIGLYLNRIGNLGVNTTSPLEQLHVSGNERVGMAPSTLTTLSSAATSSDTSVTVASTTGYPTSGTLLIDSEAMSYTGTTGTTFTGLTRGVLGTTAAAHSSSASVNSYLSTMASTATTPKMVVTANGNVGVGTASPLAPVHILNPAATGAALALASNNLTSGSSVGIDFYPRSVGAAPAVLANITAGSGNGPTGQLYFYTYSAATGLSSKMMINESGNVGIGTSTPSGIIDAQVNSTNSQIMATSYGTGVAGVFVGRSARGTGASPTASQFGDMLGMLSFRGYGATGFASNCRSCVVGYAAENWTDTAQGSLLTFNTTSIGASANSERMRIDAAGNLGVGTTSPRATLDVNGAILGKAAVSNATATIDFSTGNSQYTTSSCGAFNLNNMKDGGSYAFVVQGATAATCSFAAYSDAGSTALTVHMPPNHGMTTASTHTMYNFIVMGTHLYVSWTPGY